jgi:hypothetical protein
MVLCSPAFGGRTQHESSFTEYPPIALPPARGLFCLELRKTGWQRVVARRRKLCIPRFAASGKSSLAPLLLLCAKRHGLCG